MILWSDGHAYVDEPFETEYDLERAIVEAAPALFGRARLYLDIKKRIGGKGRVQNIPDGYLLDLSSPKEPRLFVVEVELARHDPLKHIAAQILEFSLSYETSPQVVKNAAKTAIQADGAATQVCTDFAVANGYGNIDYLLEKIVFAANSYSPLVIIDEMADELEKVLMSRFKFPVEFLTFERYRDSAGRRLYRFEPFLEDVAGEIHEPSAAEDLETIDIAELDTVVVAAREDGFHTTFLGENRWYAIRMHASMVPRIKHIAAYQVAPESAITHVAEVSSIEQWRDTNKYVLNFAAPATAIGPIRLQPHGKIKAPQAPRYSSYARLMAAKTLDDAF